jgi:hypothetical protein
MHLRTTRSRSGRPRRGNAPHLQSSDKTAASEEKQAIAVKKSVTTSDKSQNKDNQSANAAQSKAPTASGKETTEKPEVNVTPEIQEQIDALKSRAAERKRRSDKIFEDTCAAIKRMTDKELPRKKKNEKVSIVVPDGKSPGDDNVSPIPMFRGKNFV